MHFVVYFIIAFVLILILYLLLMHYLRKKRINAILTLFISHGYQAINVKNEVYDLFIETTDHIYLGKVLSIHPMKEIVMTNKTTWISHHKSTPVRIEDQLHGIKDFYNSTVDTTKRVAKFVLIYPYIHHILKYINEHEMIIIKPGMQVDGIKVLTYEQLKTNEFSL